MVGGVKTFRDRSTVEMPRKESDRGHTFHDITGKNHEILHIIEILRTSRPATVRRSSKDRPVRAKSSCLPRRSTTSARGFATDTWPSTAARCRKPHTDRGFGAPCQAPFRQRGQVQLGSQHEEPCQNHTAVSAVVVQPSRLPFSAAETAALQCFGQPSLGTPPKRRRSQWGFARSRRAVECLVVAPSKLGLAGGLRYPPAPSGSFLIDASLAGVKPGVKNPNRSRRALS